MSTTVSGLLRRRGFRALWAARTVSYLGDGVTRTALVLLTAREGSTAVAVVLLAGTVPRLLGPVGGALADRMGRRSLMRGCLFAQAAVVGLIAATLPPLPVLAALVAASALFAEHHGHVRLPRVAVQDGFELTSFVSRQRSTYCQGDLADDRIAALEAVPGWSWQPQEQAWETGLAHLELYCLREGHTLVPSDHREDGYPLGTWVREQRDRGNRTGDAGLGPERRARVEVLPGWSWSPSADSWERHFQALLSFVAREHHAGVPTLHQENGLPLGSWVIRHRLEHKNGQVPAERASRLEVLSGWMWNTRQAAWDRQLAAFGAFLARENHGLVPTGHVEIVAGEQVQLGAWVVATRSRAKTGSLDPERVADLAAMPGWCWDARAAAWDRGLSALRGYSTRTGRTSVPSGHVEDGYRLGQWLEVQRGLIRAGHLPAERAQRLVEVLNADDVSVTAPIADRVTVSAEALAAWRP